MVRILERIKVESLTPENISVIFINILNEMVGKSQTIYIPIEDHPTVKIKIEKDNKGRIIFVEAQLDKTNENTGIIVEYRGNNLYEVGYDNFYEKWNEDYSTTKIKHPFFRVKTILHCITQLLPQAEFTEVWSKIYPSVNYKAYRYYFAINDLDIKTATDTQIIQAASNAFGYKLWRTLGYKITGYSKLEYGIEIFYSKY
jgi:hypothetical protein